MCFFSSGSSSQVKTAVQPAAIQHADADMSALRNEQKRQAASRVGVTGTNLTQGRVTDQMPGHKTLGGA